MKNKISKLFGLQYFEHNDHLASVIEETEKRYDNQLSDDQLGFVNAAGDVDQLKNSGRKMADDKWNNMDL